MAKLTRSISGSSQALLRRILERSELVAALEKLSAPVLGQLIEHVGLEDAGELVAVATTRQLERVWDRDLWTRDGADGSERFDPERFATWLAVMLEAGEAQTAQRLRELPFDLLTLALHRLVHVVDRGTWSRMQELGYDDEEDEAGSMFAPWHELVLISRDDDAWDAVLAALLALDEEDHALVRKLLERCCDLDVQGDPLDGDDCGDRAEDAVLERDVAAVREGRQAGSGYVVASDARAFLRMAREKGTEGARGMERDAVTSGYFREVGEEKSEEEDKHGDEDAREDEYGYEDDYDHDYEDEDGHEKEHDRGHAGVEGIAELMGVLVDAGVVGEQKDVLQLTAGAAVPAEKEEATLLHAALRELEREDWACWSVRMEELGYLANVVLGGLRDAGKERDPRDALEAATAVCSLGLELQLSGDAEPSGGAARAVLREVSADRLFRAGYAELHAELVTPAWRVLAAKVARYGDDGLRERFGAALRAEELGALGRELDGAQLRVRQERLEAVCGLAQAIPLLAGTLAVDDARYLTTRVQLQAAQRLLRSIAGRRASPLRSTGS